MSHNANNYYSFDTYRMVLSLERNGFSRSQAVAIMRAMNVLLAESVLKTRTNMLTKIDVENETYLYKAALSELATELKMLRQNDHSALKSETESIVRDLDALAQRLRDDMNNLKSDIAMEMNNHKLDIREAGKQTELRLHEVNSKLAVMCSEFKTEIETMKLDATKRVIAILLGGAAGVLSILTLINITRKVTGGGSAAPEATAPETPIVLQSATGGLPTTQVSPSAAPVLPTLAEDPGAVDGQQSNSSWRVW
ncbi:hypothetical protein RI367_002031 [Sorochytrium milnesiophthora]